MYSLLKGIKRVREQRELTATVTLRNWLLKMCRPKESKQTCFNSFHNLKSQFNQRYADALILELKEGGQRSPFLCAL